jgi:hypothetical protein
MPKLFRIWLNVSAMTIVLSGLAYAQSVTAYDGNYAGTSRRVVADETTHHDCTQSTRNTYTLTIANGAAEMRWGKDGSLVGTVDNQGHLVMHTATGNFIVHLDGRIAPPGAVTANVSMYYCVFEMVWRKR